MKKLIYASLIVNVAVLTPIVILMGVNSPIVERAWGEFTPARGILQSIYFAILVLSVILLFVPIPAFVVPLLSAQVIYKITTPITVGALLNPIVLSNLAITVLHLVTLWVIYTHRKELGLTKI